MPKYKNKVKFRIILLKYANLCLGVTLLFYVGSFKKQANNVSSRGMAVSAVRTEQIPGYKTYYNEKFGFSIDFPNNFTKAEGNKDRNGAKFYSIDRNTILTVYGMNNTHRENPEVLFRTDLSVIKGNITYNAIRGNSYAISWTDNNMIYHRRVEAGLGCMNIFMLQYPVNQASTYNAILDDINRSFKTGNLFETY